MIAPGVVPEILQSAQVAQPKQELNHDKLTSDKSEDNSVTL